MCDLHYVHTHIVKGVHDVVLSIGIESSPKMSISCTLSDSLNAVDTWQILLCALGNSEQLSITALSKMKYI